MHKRKPKLRIGVLGAGMIATAPFGVLPNLQSMRDRVEVVAITSRRQQQAQHVAELFGIPQVYQDLDAMLAGAAIDAVVNLTPIAAHYETSIRIIEAGKHLISEKPLASTMAQADKLCAAARHKGVHIIVAPVDMLAREWRRAQRLVQEGAIGRPAFARAQSSHSGPASMSWPADPTWFYQRGAGALLDLGAYGLHRITGILGPARRVSAFSGITVPVRTVAGGPYDGMSIEVQEPDNNMLMLDFGNSIFATVDVTYNVLASHSPAMEIYGSEGALIVTNQYVSNYSFVRIFDMLGLWTSKMRASWITVRWRRFECVRCGRFKRGKVPRRSFGHSASPGDASTAGWRCTGPVAGMR